jgi:protoheme IX farnesyltransferase
VYRGPEVRDLERRNTDVSDYRGTIALRSARADYFELTKPRITLMVLLTTGVGFVMASTGTVLKARLLVALLGTGLLSAGASTLNMLLERNIDALMSRTRGRPLPSGRLRPIEALAFGSSLSMAGLLVLAWGIGALPAGVGFVTWASYLFIYTPLKPVTSLSTIVGAFPGALPPVIGWAAARGSLDPGAYVLFAILFLWQIPHFLAIAWIFRDDYALGRLPMLPVLDRAGHLTGRQAVLHTLALLLVSLTPAAAGMAGRVYLVGAVVLGLAFTWAALVAALRRTVPAARTLFLTSLVYLAGVQALLLLDRVASPLTAGAVLR